MQARCGRRCRPPQRTTGCPVERTVPGECLLLQRGDGTRDHSPRGDERSRPQRRRRGGAGRRHRPARVRHRPDDRDGRGQRAPPARPAVSRSTSRCTRFPVASRSSTTARRTARSRERSGSSAAWSRSERRSGSATRSSASVTAFPCRSSSTPANLSRDDRALGGDAAADGAGLACRAERRLGARHGRIRTGKELVARALHDLGPRRGKPFVTIDCGSLPPTLIASELFGHERGAFTGADRMHVGAFEAAQAEPSSSTRSASYRGDPVHVARRARAAHAAAARSRTELAVDVRVVAATHRDLRAEVNRGGFRLDLFYRLAVVTLTNPALRERPDDIPLLVEHFLRDAGGTRRSLSSSRLRRWMGSRGCTSPATCASYGTWWRPPSRWGSRDRRRSVVQGVAGDDRFATDVTLPYKAARAGCSTSSRRGTSTRCSSERTATSRPRRGSLR